MVVVVSSAMAGSGDVADEVVPHPAFGAVAGELARAAVDPDAGAELADLGDADAVLAGGPRIHDLVEAFAPGAVAGVAGAVRKHAGPGQQRIDRRAPIGLDAGLGVVDVPGEAAVGVDDLVVEQMEQDVEHAGGHQAPPRVMIMSGMVTTDTTSRITR